MNPGLKLSAEYSENVGIIRNHLICILRHDQFEELLWHGQFYSPEMLENIYVQKKTLSFSSAKYTCAYLLKSSVMLTKYPLLPVD